MMLADLNPQQRAAVEHREGPLLILAGAGSGKTRVITHRIAHLIAHYRIPPSAILAMTFTNKAAQEMQQRVAGLLPYSAYSQPQISTFHSFCVRSLRRDYEAIGGKRDFVIYADDEQLRLVKGIVKGLGLDDKSFAPRAVLSKISAAKNRGLTPQQYQERATDPKSERLAVIFERYQAGLRQANALDFDDLLLETERLLRQSPETAQQYNQRYTHLMIDEYQDTNHPQYDLMRLLTQEQQNLVVVGDEDQSIYSWRGADIRNILDFERDYADAKVIRLEQNYRSTKNILAAASSVVSNNRERKGKVLWTESDAGAQVGYYLGADADQEAEFVAETIGAGLARPGAIEHGVAILYRTNAQSRLFEEALRRRNLSYRVLGGFSFYERAEVRDLLAYLRLASNPADSAALWRILNVPSRGIGKTTQDALEQLAMQENLTALQAIERGLEGMGGLPARSLATLAEFYKMIARFRAAAEAGTAVDELLRMILEDSGYRRALQEEATPDAESRLENLGELVNAAADAAGRGDTVAAFLDHAALVSDADDYDPQATVQMMSLHSAKGLEFGVVFLAGLEEGLFPHSRTFDHPADLEEERRLCYVGMTRARQRLYLTHAARRRRFAGQAYEPSVPSRFLSEVPAELLENLSPAAPGWAPRGPRYVSEGFNQEIENRTKPAGGSFRHTYNSVESIHEFFGKGGRPRAGAEAAMQPTAKAPSPAAGKRGAVSNGGMRAGARVRHTKFGVGTVLQIEGEGDHTKLTVSFPGYGLKKMVEKLAGLTPV